MVPNPADQTKGSVEIGAPDIAAIDHAHRKRLAGGQGGEHCVELIGRADEIDMQPGNREPCCQFAIVAQVAEIGGEQDIGTGLAQHRIGLFESGLLLAGKVEHQHRLVDLHPVCALVLELGQQFGIDRQQRVEQVERIETVILRLCQAEEGDRPQDHRPCDKAKRPCLTEMIERFSGVERERLIAVQLGHDEMIIGVEPLGHLHGRGSIGATGHGEIACVGVGNSGKARRDGADQHRSIQHMVVERKIVRGDHLDAGLTLQAPMAGPELGGGGVQGGGVAFALPIGFEGFFQLAIKADAGKAEIG